MRPSRLFLPASFLLLILAGPQIAQAQSFLTEWGTFGTGNGQFDTPSQIATDAAGNVYVADRQNNRIQKFTSTGVYITQWGSLGAGNGQFNSPSGIATNAAGEVYVADFLNNRIQKFTGAGAYLSQWGTPGGGGGQFNHPFSIAVGPNGDVYVVDYHNHRVQRFTGTGTFLNLWGGVGTGNGKFRFPSGITTDAAGNVYVGDILNARIEKFTANGTYVGEWGSYGSGPGQFGGANILVGPYGLTTDHLDNVYVADGGNSRIEKFTSNGVYLGQWGTVGSGPGQFGADSPADIGRTSDGLGIYASERVGNRVQLFGIPPAPSPANSTVPSIVAFGPNGTSCFDIVVRDANANPIPGSSVVLDFSACPIVFCAAQPGGVIANPALKTAGLLTNALGAAHFCICASSSAACSVAVSADGVLLAMRPTVQVGSPAGDTCTTEGWRTVANVGPAPRWESAMVANDARGTLFLFGGYGGSPSMLTTFDDTWEWDGELWRVTGSGGPDARSGHAMAYDRERGRVVLFGGEVAGGSNGETWEWDANNGWVLRAVGGPAARSGHAMAFDEVTRRVILFGGSNGSSLFGDTWAWDGNQWSPAAPAGPAARTRAAMASDVVRKRIVLYGGSTTNSASGALDDTWEFDGAAWQRATKPVWNGSALVQVDQPGPPARWRHTMAFGASCGRVIMTGGYGTAGVLMQTTWSWDGSQWRQGANGLATGSASMAYDITRSKVTLFGGSLAFAMSGDTQQLCTLCNDEAAELDSTGNVLYPPTLDGSQSILIDDNVEIDRGEISTLYPGRHTSADSWLKDFPCAPAIGGTVPSEASDPAIDDSLLANGINYSSQDISDSLGVWEQQIMEMFQSDPDSLPFAPPVGVGAYVLPDTAYCPPDSGNYVFGGRDIVFVHGLQLDEVFDRIKAVLNDDEDHKSLVDWVRPHDGIPGYQLNPEFYNEGGYYRTIADKNIGEHLEKFFTVHNIRNRYLIVAYPCNDRLEVGIQAMLTQINDAMRYGRRVRNPFGTDTLKFGTPSFVIVSHSTGGLLADAALHAAQTNLNLNAKFIAERCKAHVGLASAVSGSRLATAALVAGGVASNAAGYGLACELFKLGAPYLGIDDFISCPSGIGLVMARSVLVDLVPAYSRIRWGPAIDSTNIPTVNLIGGHSHAIPLLKHTISPGFDDGVLTSNCASANPGFTAFWPAGFITAGPVGMYLTVDMDLVRKQVRRAVQYYLEQTFDGYKNPLIKYIPFYISAGPIPYLSPTGMLQTVAFPLEGTPFDATRRFNKHYSFMSCAADHFNIRSGKEYPDYMSHMDIKDVRYEMERNYEEARVILESDEPALRAHYNTLNGQHYPHDDQPLLTAACTPPVHDYKMGSQRGFKIKVFGKTYEKYWWIWQRHYMRPANVSGKHVCDYMYESILKCESAIGLCRTRTVGVDDEPAAQVDFARILSNPVRGGVARIEFGLARAARVRVSIFDLAGRQVMRLADQPFEAGVHRMEWNGRDASGSRVRAGAYFLRVQTDDHRFRTVRKMILVD